MESAPRSGRRAATLFILVTVMLDMLAFGMVAPVLPTLLLQLVGDDPHLAAFHNGWMGTVWAAFQFVSMPVMGALSDAYGRRRVVLLSTFGLAASFLLFAVAPSLAWLYAARVVSGITSANFSTASAYIADVTPPEGRAKAFGLISAAFGVGFILGPAASGVLAKVDPRLPFYLAAGLSLLNACYGLFVLPESLPKENRTPFHLPRANPFGAAAFLAQRRGVLGLALMLLVLFLVHVLYPNLFSLYVQSRFQWGPDNTAFALALVGIGSAIVGGLLIQPSIKLFGERGAILIGLILGAVSMAIYGAAPTGTLFLVGLVPGILAGITQPALSAMMSRRVGASEQGALQGATGMLRGLADMTGPLLFSNLAYGVGLSIGVPGLPWFLGGALVALALLIALSVTAPLPAPAAEPASETS